MPPVERGRQLVDETLGERDRRHVHAALVHLVDVLHIDGALEVDVVVCKPLLGELTAPLLLQRAEELVEAARVERR